MFELQATITNAFDKIEKEATKANFKNIGHALARIRKDEAASIQKSDEPSPAGTPPHTRGRRGQSLKRSFRFDVTDDDGIVGPMHSIVGEAARKHEFGGRFDGQDFDQRSFALPALEASIDRIAAEWYGTIGE